MKRTRRGQGGYILVFVLLILVILSVLVAALYAQADEFRSTNLSSTFVQVATVNAERGVQEAMRGIRSGAINPGGLSGTCVGGDYKSNCAIGSYIEIAAATDGGTILDNGPGTNSSPLQGGGLQFNYVVYRSANVVNQPLNRYTIQSTGYAGMSLTSASLISSVVEVEIEVGASGTFSCVNTYECT